MKENNELERSDLVVDRDIQIDDNDPYKIVVYLETWFDCDKKFGTDTADFDDKWLNLYAMYNPIEDTLEMEYTVSTDDSSETIAYTPSESEAILIKAMITEKIKEEHGQTPKAFCEEVLMQDEEVYVYRNTKNLSEKGLLKQHNTIKEYMESNGYANGGSISIPCPMSRSGEHYQNMVDYCKAHGILKVVVADTRDIGNNLNELFIVVNDLQNKKLSIEVVNSDISQVPKEEQQEVPEEEPENGITMGGM